MDPVVLVLSYGATPPMEIVENIFSEVDQPKEATSTECSLNCYRCIIKTKYYNTSINLVPFSGKLESVPEKILQATEALIIYFDSKDSSFIETIPKTLAKNEQIQLGFLLTSSTSEERGLSFGEIKERTNFFFDIITLKSNVESDSDETERDYEEVVEGLKNVVWSNVKFGSEHKEDISSDELDSQLKDFENLLLTAQSLRNDTSLTREQFLDRAEQFAGIVSSILNDNDSE
ncbi:alpha- and gamma-adaptin-binding protein p34 [Drosophila suzukii]|uniref:Alpha- and gamma-adaptin-binding protein p34 n=1 Tax=Drosophila suzukii TaxID=28584 RepID=A0AB40A3E4_DROSZ